MGHTDSMLWCFVVTSLAGLGSGAAGLCHILLVPSGPINIYQKYYERSHNALNSNREFPQYAGTMHDAGTQAFHDSNHGIMSVKC